MFALTFLISSMDSCDCACVSQCLSGTAEHIFVWRGPGGGGGGWWAPEVLI